MPGKGITGGDYSVDGTGMDGIEVDLDALRKADAALAELQDQLVGHHNAAADLAQPLKDGRGPVANQMRAAFHLRADDQGGVQAALADYLDEVVNIRMAISETLDAYASAEDAALVQMRSVADEQGQE